MLRKLKHASKLISGGVQANIIRYESDEYWIRVELDQKPTKEFAYPAFVMAE